MAATLATAVPSGPPSTSAPVSAPPRQAHAPRCRGQPGQLVVEREPSIVSSESPPMVEGAWRGEGGRSKTALVANNEAAATGCRRPIEVSSLALLGATGCRRPIEVSSLALLGIPPRGVAGHAAKGGGGTSNAAYAGAGGARGSGSCDAGVARAAGVAPRLGNCSCAARAAGVDGGGAWPDCGPASGGRQLGRQLDPRLELTRLPCCSRWASERSSAL